jgi:hypothetical protein
VKTALQLVILLILIITGVVIYGLHLGGSDNPINKELRSSILKSTLTKSVLALNDPGDHKFMYASPATSSITVEVDVQAGIVPHPSLKSWLEGMLKETLGKQADVRIDYDNNIPPQTSFTYTELLSIAKKTRDPLLAAQANYLHIIYLSSSANEPTNAGMVLTSTDMFIFKHVINELNQMESIRARIEHSTIKHEWAHLLGIDHVDQENCIMSPRVEVYENRRFQGGNIPTEYCPETLFLIDQLKKEASKK